MIWFKAVLNISLKMRENTFVRDVLTEKIDSIQTD